MGRLVAWLCIARLAFSLFAMRFQAFIRTFVLNPLRRLY
jgi:hypothetical protein